MKTKHYLKILMTVLIWLPVITMAQGVAINDDNSDADPSAMLDVKSTDKGVLFPRLLTQQIRDIIDPAPGLIVFNLEENRFYFWESSSGSSGLWKEISIGSNAIASPFTQCGDYLTDSRDGQVYTTVQIGTQCWMAENLNIGAMINGSNNQTDNFTIEKYCYDNNTSNCDAYGGLYQWNEMMAYITTEGSQGICPDGWHLPANLDYNTLSTYLGGSGVAGGKMKETGITFWNSPNTGATNTSGFTGLGAGYRRTDGAFLNVHESGSFWISFYPYNMYLRNYHELLEYGGVDPNFGLSVRCLKD